MMKLFSRAKGCKSLAEATNSPAVTREDVASGNAAGRHDLISVLDALRFLDSQAKLCRDRDDHEALCLLLPAMMRVLELRPMDGYEETEFRKRFKEALQKQ